MVARIKKHFWYYAFFLILQFFGFILVVFTAANKQLQIFALVVTTAIYIAWALLHQQLHHSLTKKIVVEYVLVGVLGLTISLFLFNA